MIEAHSASSAETELPAESAKHAGLAHMVLATDRGLVLIRDLEREIAVGDVGIRRNAAVNLAATSCS